MVATKNEEQEEDSLEGVHDQRVFFGKPASNNL